MDFADLLDLDPVAGATSSWWAPSPVYPWGGLYGGQVAAQSLRAAAATVGDDRAVHSLQLRFLRRGRVGTRVRYDVEAPHDGRGFCTRVVRAVQGDTDLAVAMVGFQVPEGGAQVPAVPVPTDAAGPERLACDSWTAWFDRRFATPRLSQPGRALAWFRVDGPLGADPVVHACAIAFCSDDLPTDAVISLHPDRPPHLEAGADPARAFSGASLDHAVWFHRPAPADDWLLHDLRAESFTSGRGLCTGRIVTADGTLVASLAQEVLLRPPR